MRKLKLEVEELTVESFAADDNVHSEDGHAFGRLPGDEGGIAGITGTCMCTLNCAVPSRYLTCGSTCAC